MVDKVKLLSKHLKDFEIIEDAGSYDGKGVWVESKTTTGTFKAAPFPITGNDLRLFQQGDLTLDDLKIYTKQDLSNIIDKEIRRVSNGKIYKMKTDKPFDEIADIKIYILKKWEGES